MTGFVVVLSPEAERDISEAFLWYRERNALAAGAFRTEVFDSVERIAEAPLTWPADDEGNRRRVVRHFPYTVIYE
ncbi:MAG TPA: type II toxin-antitoxin system RelE/ParE family toxin, partial [Ramlibacter sp.]|nr:type II toxin-antitoxin system RelE/ParE family toxin [Ramlibacter sp.]